MFIVSIQYRLTFGTLAEPVHHIGYVAAYNHPLVRLRDLDAELGTGVIYNLSHPNFLLAEQWDYSTGRKHWSGETL